MIALEAPSGLSAGSRFLRTLGAVVSVPVITKAVDRLGPRYECDVDALTDICIFVFLPMPRRRSSMCGRELKGGGKSQRLRLRVTLLM
jgi:hypothetical protein